MLVIFDLDESPKLLDYFFLQDYTKSRSSTPFEHLDGYQAITHFYAREFCGRLAGDL